jgi:hypothetical protein
MKEINLKTESNTSLPMIQTGKINDLLQAKPIREMVKDFGIDKVKIEIIGSIVKCATGLGINMSETQTLLLCEDIMDVYPYESVEDVCMVLRNGRTGKYGFGHNSRNVLNMILIREWMTLHLEEKATAREKVIEKRKKEIEENYQAIDTEKAMERIKTIRDLIVIKPKETVSVGITKSDFIDKLKQDLPNSTPEMIHGFLSELQKNPDRWKEEIELINKYLKK